MSFLKNFFQKKEDYPDGLNESYHPNGKLKRRGNVEIGMKFGVWEEFNESGKLVLSENYSFNMKHGMTEEYDKDGNIILLKIYEEGKLYDETKDLEVIESYKLDKGNGQNPFWNDFFQQDDSKELNDLQNDNPSLDDVNILLVNGSQQELRSVVENLSGGSVTFSEKDTPFHFLFDHVTQTLLTNKDNISEEKIEEFEVMEPEFKVVQPKFYLQELSGIFVLKLVINGNLFEEWTTDIPENLLVGNGVRVTHQDFSNFGMKKMIIDVKENLKRNGEYQEWVVQILLEDSYKLIEQGFYKDDKKEGTWTRYLNDGSILTENNYKEGELLE